MRPAKANELWSALVEIFPDFATDSPEGDIESDSTLHSVLMSFVPYFSGHLETFSEKQIKSLAELINEAVTIDDDLENAFGTCFLEHLVKFAATGHWRRSFLVLRKRRAVPNNRIEHVYVCARLAKAMRLCSRLTRIVRQCQTSEEY